MEKTLILINPAAGQNFSILHFLQQHIDLPHNPVDIKVLTKPKDIQNIFNDPSIDTYKRIAVYGGDGTVTSIAGHLYNKNIPLIILPGGTANILAKELQIPENMEGAVKAITSSDTILKKVDVGVANNIPFMLRISTGPLADMILNTNQNLKQTVGQIAYGVSMIQELQNSPRVTYSLTIDGKHIEEQGISLIIANSGNLGFAGFSFLPTITIDDGLFDIFILKMSDLGYITSVLKEAIIDKSTSPLIHYQGKHINVTITPNQSAIFDDTSFKPQTFTAHILPQALKVLIPQT